VLLSISKDTINKMEYDFSYGKSGSVKFMCDKFQELFLKDSKYNLEDITENDFDSLDNY